MSDLVNAVEATEEQEFKTPSQVAEALANTPVEMQIAQFTRGIEVYSDIGSLLRDSMFPGKNAARVANAIQEAFNMVEHLKGQLKAMQKHENERLAADKVAKKADKKAAAGE